MALDPRFAKAYETLRQSRIKYMSATQTRDIENLPELQEARRDLDVARSEVRARRKEFHPTEQDLRFQGVLGRCVTRETSFRLERRLMTDSRDGVIFVCPICTVEVATTLPTLHGEHRVWLDETNGSTRAKRHGVAPDSEGQPSGSSAPKLEVASRLNHLTVVSRLWVSQLLRQHRHQAGVVILRQLSVLAGGVDVRLTPMSVDTSGDHPEQSVNLDSSQSATRPAGEWHAMPAPSRMRLSTSVSTASGHLTEHFTVPVEGTDAFLLTIRATPGSQPAAILLHRIR